MKELSRREFASLVASAAAPLVFGQGVAGSPAITADDLIARIKAQIGVPWKPETIDGLKAGDGTTVVTGVASTALATLAVLRRAADAGANFVVTTQPTFYSRADTRQPPSGRSGRGGIAAPPAPAITTDLPPADPVSAAKNSLIDERKLVVFRLSEHWRLRQPDPLADGIAQAMGWTKYRSLTDPRRFDVPAQMLASLVSTIQKNLGARGGIRVVGDPQTTVRRIGLLPGSTPIQASLALLPDVDVILAGEVREWESVEYARDHVFGGEKKALILVGRVVSEEPGMRACADWLKTVTPDLPVRHLPAGDPYWRPA